MKTIRNALLTLLPCFVLLVLSRDLSALHPHVTTTPSCTTPSVCMLCQIVTTPSLGHDATETMCTEPSVCTRCGERLKEPLGHETAEATCTEGKRCLRCGEHFSPPLGHTVTEATCTEPSACTRCGEHFGRSLGHEIVSASCTEAKKCLRCGKSFGKRLGHQISPATCIEEEYCTRCGTSFAEPLGHSITEATCTEGAHCLRCQTVFSDPLGHQWTRVVTVEAGCLTNGSAQITCTVCGVSTTEILPPHGHWYDETGQTCMLCGYTRVYLNVEMLYQGTDFPNGCESVSAVMVLRYLGFDITVGEWIEAYLPMSSIDYSGSLPTVENPADSFIGDPRTFDGYYCFAPAIASAVNGMLAEKDESGAYSCNMPWNASLGTLCTDYIAAGIPVILWSTLSMNPPCYIDTVWQLRGTEEQFSPYANLHCVVLVGYDENGYYINDPMAGLLYYTKERAEASYNAMGMQSVVITKN